MSAFKLRMGFRVAQIALVGLGLVIGCHHATGANSTSQVFIACASLVRGATNAAEGMITPVPLPFARPSVFEGTASQISSNRIVVAAGAWTPNEFASCYVEFASGQMAAILTNDLNSLTLDSAVQLPLGARFRIHPFHTIKDVFDALTPGDTIDSADNVLLFDPSTQATRTIFLSTNNTPAWSDQDGVDSANATIPTRQTVLLRRRAANDVVLVSHGIASPAVCNLTVFEGLNWLTTPCIGGDYTLDQLRLFINGNPITGLGAGTDANTADTLMTVSPDGESTTFFHSSLPGYTGWRDLSLVSAATNHVKAGTPLLIHRQAPRGSFLWRSPGRP